MKVFEHPDTTKSWDEIYYDNDAAIRYFDNAISKMLDLLGVKPGDRLLDAGCGAGVHSIRCARFGCTVDAIYLGCGTQ